MSDKLVLGCGYLGRRVAAAWRARGRRVFATTRAPARAPELRGLGLEPVVCDVLDLDSLHALPEAETLVYCVGLDRAAGVPMRTVYVDGLAHVLAELGRRPPAARPERFLYVSSTGVYGQGRGEEVDETTPAEPADESGRVVLEAEQLLRERRPDAMVLRFAGIYGPGRLMRAQALRAGAPLAGDPDHWLNLIHVEDGAAAVLAAEEKGRPGQTYLVCDGYPVRRRDFYSRLASLLGAPSPRFTPTVPDAARARDARGHRRLVNHRLRQELGVVLKYPSFEEGLADCL